jgi:flavin-dependent dehydrogenase
MRTIVIGAGMGGVAAAIKLRQAGMDEVVIYWVTGCRSWYLDDRGIPAAWPFSFDRFRDAMETPVRADFEVA